MKKTQRHHAFTLVEMLIVVAIMAILVGMSVPAVRSTIRSHHRTAAQNMVAAALNLAKAHAAQTQRYAGIRFQPEVRYNYNEKYYYLTGKQYLVLIECNPYDTAYNYNIFNAVPDTKPQPLPNGLNAISGVVSLLGSPDDDDNLRNTIDDPRDTANNHFNTSRTFTLLNAQTFTFVFSPNGSLVVRDVFVRERNNSDMVFGRRDRIEQPVDPPLLFHDGWNTSQTTVWCPNNEPSAASLFLYETDALESIPANARYSQFFMDYDTVPDIQKFVINTYTGSIINPDDLK